MKATTKLLILQVHGMVRMAFRCGNDPLGPESGAPKTLFRLPFKGPQVVLNSNGNEETPHSQDAWEHHAGGFVATDGRAQPSRMTPPTCAPISATEWVEANPSPSDLCLRSLPCKARGLFYRERKPRQKRFRTPAP